MKITLHNLVFSFLPNQLSICPLHKYCIHQKLPQVLKFPPGISYIERNNDFSFNFLTVCVKLHPMLATLYALRTLPSFK